MKPFSIELPEKLAAEVKRYVKAGWFDSETEVVQTALREFIRRNRIELMEGFLKEDHGPAGKRKPWDEDYHLLILPGRPWTTLLSRGSQIDVELHTPLALVIIAV